MCGLAGWISGAPSPAETSQNILENMLIPLTPRGPDDQQTWISRQVALGHTRLKIIDLESGQQPMVSDRSTLVFNGEIYNYPSLKKELENLTGPFQSKSDTEVLQRSLEHWGIEALKKIRGMFALAFYHHGDQSLLLARDPVGQKPLFYSFVDNHLIFASTCQSLRQHPFVDSTISQNSLFHYLINEAPPEPETLYQHIKAVPSGHWCLFQNNHLTIEPYWSWPQQTSFLSYEEEIDQFSKLFKQSVERRLRSDVPLGVFLSGGLDSSSVVWQAKQSLTNSTLKTFSIGFDEPTFDESKYSQQMAQTLKTDHHHTLLTEKNVLDVLPQALASCDQPLADASLLPFYLLCQQTKQSVTVALSGDGADDLMAGYDPFRAIRWAHLTQKIPQKILSWCESLVHRSPPQDNNLPWSFKIKQFLRGQHLRGGNAMAHWMSAWSPKEISHIISNNTPTPTLWSEHNSDETLEAIAYFRSRYLRDQILVKVDRSSMAHSLEVRNPFLDQDLVEFVSHLPSQQLFHHQQGKWPLRHWADNKLPKQIIKRSKKGFGIPLSRWLRGPLSGWVTDLMSPSTLQDIGLNSSYALRIRDEHLSGQRDWPKEIWTLCVLCDWWTRR